MPKERSFDMFLTSLRLPRAIFRGFSEGPPKSSILHILTISDNPPGTLRNPSKYYFLQFSMDRRFYRVCQAGPLQYLLKVECAQQKRRHCPHCPQARVNKVPHCPTSKIHCCFKHNAENCRPSREDIPQECSLL